MALLLIVDIDGTLADASHRLHYIKQEQPDWASFMDPELLIKDTAQPFAREVLNSFRAQEYEMCFLTGRTEAAREATEAWLNTRMDRRPSWEPVFMRTPKYANMHASVYKELQLKEIMETHYTTYTRRGGWDKIFFEDDPFVARMYMKHGIVMKAPECWQFMNQVPTKEEEPLWRH